MDMRSYKTVRLPHFDYNETGAYFLTTVTANRECLFGRIEDGAMIANAFGQIVIEEWLRSATIRSEIRLDMFTLMPNHFHGIVFITDDLKAHIHAAPRQDFGEAHIHAALRSSRKRTPRSISTLMGGFKGAVTARINTLRNTPAAPVWQPKFHDHVIRDEHDLNDIREYIQNNPLKWDLDRENPDFKP
ncbi:MAG: transposase [bacterium]|nr:transposase [bacterium]